MAIAERGAQPDPSICRAEMAITCVRLPVHHLADSHRTKCAKEASGAIANRYLNRYGSRVHIACVGQWEVRLATQAQLALFNLRSYVLVILAPAEPSAF